MWTAPETWHPLPGAGPATRGLWIVPGVVDLVAKRIDRPGGQAEETVFAPDSASYWRREVDVALSGAVRSTRGIRSPVCVEICEDDDGVLLFHERVAGTVIDPLQVAGLLGVFNAEPVPECEWACTQLQAQRLTARLRRGAWPLLARTHWADLADAVWTRQSTWVTALESMPTGLAHGDLTPKNVLGWSDSSLAVVDWASCGGAALGEDLGYYWLSVADIGLETLADAYLVGFTSLEQAQTESCEPLRSQMLQAARTVAVLTGFTRAEWVLSRIVDGEGPLAGKLSHPSVARHLSALARLRPHVDALLGI